MLDRIPVAARCVAAGSSICLALPPWGWWPLAIIGLALLDDLLRDQPWASRARRTWLVAVTWLAPGMVWMWDLTPPGYVLASVVYAGYFALAAALTPPGAGRRIALPGAFALAELSRWSFPFGGVPLATLPQSQVATPWAQIVRIAGPLLLAAAVVVLGQAAASARRRELRPGALGAALVAGLVLVALIAPDGHAVGTLDVAAVQGGGPQRTRAEDTEDRVVFDRHMAASELIDGPVDLVLWPENVVNVDGRLVDNVEHQELGDLARRLDATLVAGTVETISDTGFLNAAVAYSPEGELVGRFDKVRTVPFGEFVPLRSLIEKLSSEVPSRDAIAGSGPGMIDTPEGRFGVVISWEAFFANRGRSGIAEGGRALLNPTNGSSYWLTIVQTQQVASLQLRAMETGRWVVEAAPTGFSSIITPDGEVIDRTAVSERAVVQGTIELRGGDTWYVAVGDWPMIVGSMIAIAAAWLLARRPPEVAAPTR